MEQNPPRFGRCPNAEGPPKAARTTLSVQVPGGVRARLWSGMVLLRGGPYSLSVRLVEARQRFAQGRYLAAQRRAPVRLERGLLDQIEQFRHLPDKGFVPLPGLIEASLNDLVTVHVILLWGD